MLRVATLYALYTLCALNDVHGGVAPALLLLRSCGFNRTPAPVDICQCSVTSVPL